MSRHVLMRLEAAMMGPDALLRDHSPAPARFVHGKDGGYWQSGEQGIGPTALTEAACNRVAAEGVLGRANVPTSLARIPWC